MGGTTTDYRWAGVDWSQTDAAIAGQLGVSHQAVYHQRRRRGRATDRRAALDRFRAFVRAHRERLDGVQIRDALAAAGVPLPATAAWRVLRAEGVRSFKPRARPPRPPPRLAAANWDLPNHVLAAVWGISRFSVAGERWRRKHPRAKWNVQRPEDLADPAYQAALRRERERAGAAGGRAGQDPAPPRPAPGGDPPAGAASEPAG